MIDSESRNRYGYYKTSADPVICQNRPNSPDPLPGNLTVIEKRSWLSRAIRWCVRNWPEFYYPEFY